MKNNFFKFGAALTAALMVFSALSAVAFADEVDAVEEAPAVVETVDTEAPAEDVETPAEDVEAPAEDVEAPAEDAEVPAEDVEAPAEDVEAPAEDVEAPAEDAEVPTEVVVPMEVTEGVTEEEVQLAAEDVATGSVITIGDISATDAGYYYTVSVPISVENAPEQMTFFVYDITSITDGNNQSGFTATTPAGYIDQQAGAASGTLVFNLPKGETGETTATNGYNTNSVIVVKAGGTGVDVPDAKSYALADAEEGGDVTLGDVNGDGIVNIDDVNLVLSYYLERTTLTDDQMKAADVAAEKGSVNIDDVNTILSYYLERITSFE